MNDILDNDLKEIEAQLAKLSPNQMPDDMLNRMEQAMISWEAHLTVEEKIVPFDSNTSNTQSTSKTSKLHLWGAAAAVALMGCVAGVFMTGDSKQSSLIVDNSIPGETSSSDVPDRVATNTMPEFKFSRNITHASNEGITFAGKNEKPFKVLRIEYTEKVVTKDKDGNEVITEKPCVEHVLVPVPVH